MTEKDLHNTQAFFDKGNVKLICGKGDLLKVVDGKVKAAKNVADKSKTKGKPHLQVPYCGR